MIRAALLILATGVGVVLIVFGVAIEIGRRLDRADREER